MSKLERTLRLPYLIKLAVRLFLTRTLLLWVFFGLVNWLIFHNFLVAMIIGFLITLVWEMFSLHEWHKKHVLPTHLKHISMIKLLYNKSETFSEMELVNQIEESVKKSAWNIVHSGYLVLPSWGWEIVFKTLYPFLVSDKQVPYQNLLIGFNNKTVEADQKLWEISQEKNLSIQKKLLEQYLEVFGSRVEDIDLAYPTLRERPKAIESLIALSKLTLSPKFLVETAGNKREQSLKQVYQHLRVPVPVFNWLLQIVQNNVTLREDRRYYEFQADYYLRQMLLSLAKRVKISEYKLFSMAWKEVKNAVHR